MLAQILGFGILFGGAYIFGSGTLDRFYAPDFKVKWGVNPLSSDIFEGDSYVISAYFTDPNLICSKISQRSSTNNRLVLKGDSNTLNIPMNEADVISENFFTQGKCFYSMVNFIYFL